MDSNAPFHQLLQRVIKTVEFLKLSLSPLYDTLIHDQDFLTPFWNRVLHPWESIHRMSSFMSEKNEMLTELSLPPASAPTERFCTSTQWSTRQTVDRSSPQPERRDSRFSTGQLATATTRAWFVSSRTSQSPTPGRLVRPYLINPLGAIYIYDYMHRASISA